MAICLFVPLAMISLLFLISDIPQQAHVASPLGVKMSSPIAEVSQ